MEEFEVKLGVTAVFLSRRRGQEAQGARGGAELSRPNLLGDQLRRLPMVLPLPPVT